MKDANRPRWDGTSRGHYEVWYLTMSDPASRRGFWFRYTLEAPKDPAREPVAELWAFAFTPGRPAVGSKRPVPLEWPPRGLEEGRAVGEVDGLSWDLRWDPSDTDVWHIPGWVGRSRIPSTCVVSPAVDATFTGRVTMGDDVVKVAAAGCQTHLWGRRHAARWAWGHCSAFDEGRALLEAVWAVPLLAPGRAAPTGLTLMHVEVEGERFACNAFPWLLRARSKVESPRWELRGRTRGATVRAVLEAAPAEMAQVTYEDPDGARAWCANSEIARCALEVHRNGRLWRRFTSEGLAHVEFGDRRPDPRVPLLA